MRISKRKEAGRNRLLMERASRWIEGFNQVQLTLSDLYNHCDLEGIEVVWEPMRIAHGCSLFEEGEPYICLNPLISKSEKVVAGFHEYFHLIDGAHEQIAFSTGSYWNLSKLEYQAQVVGCIAYMPEPLIEGLNLDQIMARCGVSRDLALFRMSLIPDTFNFARVPLPELE